MLVSCGADGCVEAWEEGAGGHWRRRGGPGRVGGRTIRAAAWSPDGNLLAVAGFDACVTVWAPTQAPGEGADSAEDPWELWATLEGHESEVKDVAWNASGTLLATCGRDKTVWIWERVGEPGPGDADLCDFECVEVLQGHEADVKCLAWHPQMDVLVTGSYDGSLRVWCEEEGCGGEWGCVQTAGGEHTVWDVAFAPGDGQSPEGWALASCDDSGAVALWEFDVGQAPGGSPLSSPPVRAERVHEGPAYSLDWDPGAGSDLRLATGGADGHVALLSTSASSGSPELKVSSRFSAHAPSEINCARWRPAGSADALLATSGDDELIRLWNLPPSGA